MSDALSDKTLTLIPYSEIFADLVRWVEKGGVNRYWALAFAITVATLWWFMLIRLLSTTAQKFVRTMTTVSHWLGIRPRLAGAMLLPLGNGAPNLFSAMAAIRKGNANLAIGSAIGSSLFMTTVVVSLAVFGAGSLEGKGMLWRDCAFSLLGSCAIFGLVLRRDIRLVEPIALLILYVVYVVVVSIGMFHLHTWA
eukprot:SAG31_NODE_252_length_19068_cov_18.307713_14_plen_195_part_00